MTDKILEVRGLTKTYGGEKRKGAKQAAPTLDVLRILPDHIPCSETASSNAADSALLLPVKHNFSRSKMPESHPAPAFWQLVFSRALTVLVDKTAVPHTGCLPR